MRRDERTDAYTCLAVARTAPPQTQLRELEIVIRRLETQTASTSFPVPLVRRVSSSFIQSSHPAYSCVRSLPQNVTEQTATTRSRCRFALGCLITRCGLRLVRWQGDTDFDADVDEMTDFEDDDDDDDDDAATDGNDGGNPRPAVRSVLAR